MGLTDLKYNSDGLIPAVIQDEKGQVLMLAYMNEESLNKTLETGFTWFYSRSRQKLWQKGETSGHTQLVRKIVADCDRDSLLITVLQNGPGACHQGNESCFSYPIQSPEASTTPPAFDPSTVYGPQIIQTVYDVVLERQQNPKEGSYTNYLLKEGIDKILKKIGEEATEVIIAAKNLDKSELIYETSDFLYHLMVLLVEKEVELKDIWQELSSRR